MSLARVNPRRDQTEPAIVDYLRKRGCMVTRVSGRGTPDLLCGYVGRWFLVEVKAGSGKPTLAQERFLEEAKAHGLPAHIVRNLTQAQMVLERMERLT